MAAPGNLQATDANEVPTWRLDTAGEHGSAWAQQPWLRSGNVARGLQLSVPERSMGGRMQPNRLESYMTRNILTVRPGTSLAKCARLHIQRGIRHLPVVDDRHDFVGLVEDTDVFGRDPLGENPIASELVAQDVMMDAPVVAGPHESLEAVLEKLAGHRAEAAVVLDGKQVVGMFTDTDAVRLASSMIDPRLRVIDVARRPVRTIDAGTSAFAAWSLMLGERIRHLVVMDEAQRPIGVVSFGDVVENGLQPERGPSVRQTIRRPLETIGASSTARQAAATMERLRIGCLPVLDGDERMIAIVTRTDIMTALTSLVRTRVVHQRDIGPRSNTWV
jgi:CBS domain-containing protein